MYLLIYTNLGEVSVNGSTDLHNDGREFGCNQSCIAVGTNYTVQRSITKRKLSKSLHAMRS